ncbi:Alpha/beta superfamily hydrolase [unidentified eubacterium SCB49]|nr:Alpha/beta superfamily hydrolase [unidentified eubacterium SCB49]
MIIDKNNILTGGKKPIIFDCFYTKTTQPKPIVIFCHGYKGFKDWGAWDIVAQTFAKAGFFFVKFNFSHNGGSVKQPLDFPDLEAFAQNNYSLELEDLDRIIEHFGSENKYAMEADANTISLIGHSRGGGIVLIKAEEDSRISKVVTLAGVSDYKSRFLEGSDTFKNWKETGRFFVENGRTKQQMPHDWQFYTDFVANENRLTISRAAKAIKKPWLIIHGDNDTTVTIEEAKALHNWNPNSRLEIIKDANHVFEASHPWSKDELPTNLKKVIKTTTSFFKE